MSELRYHIRTLEDEYQIVNSNTGDVEITISKRLGNAWFLAQTCNNLLLINQPTKPKPKVM